jgi:tRNA A22 N-methylase
VKSLGKKHNRKALRRLHDQGIELTPEELARERHAAYETIRAQMRAKGYAMPDDDVEMFLLLQRMGRNNGT